MSASNRFCLYSPPLSGISSYYEMVDLAAKHGLVYLETLNILELSTPDVDFAKKLRAYAADKGISFPCVSVGMNLVGEDHREAIEAVKNYAQVAAALGSPYLHHTICLEFEDYRKVANNFDLFYNRGLAAVREIYDYAQALGIRTLYEDQGFLFNGRENFARFLKDVGRDVGVVADFGNIQFVDEEVEDFIAAFPQKICHVHAKDYRVTPGTARAKEAGEYTTKGGNYLLDCHLGQGHVHLDRAFEALRAVGYYGPISLECSPIGPDEEAGFRGDLDTINSYIGRYL